MMKVRFEPDEPMHCMKKRCTEELNGLWHVTEDKGEGITLDAWLCGKHAKEFCERYKIKVKA